jgi:hypothetical protein
MIGYLNFFTTTVNVKAHRTARINSMSKSNFNHYIYKDKTI